MSLFDPDERSEETEALNEEALEDLNDILTDVMPETPDTDDLVTKEDLEDQLSDTGGVTEDEAAEIAQQYSLGGLHHIIEGECDHPEHQRIREQLGIAEEEEGESGESSETGEEDEPEPESEGNGTDEEKESTVTDSEPSESDGDSDSGAWGTHG